MKLPWCAALAAASLSAQTFAGAPALDEAINQAIAQDRLPGAVLLVGHDGQIVYRKAYGKRALVPQPETMTLDTIFDCASLTKVIATTPSLMKLFEQGKFRLNDKVTDYIPEFQGGKSDITLRDLFTHFSGLQPDVPLKPEWTGYDTGIRLACTTKPAGPPGVRFVYSDINFILLGEIVHRLSGQMLSDYARRNIFLPLGMRDTMFLPPTSLVPRIAPTERVDKTGPPLRGVVHDPSARAMGGVAGHAGLFSTAADLARFCQMMLNGGSLDGVRLFSPLTVAKFTQPQSPPGQPILRGLGWDIDSPYSGNSGELFPIGSYGHTGFTGTSIWLDPSTQSYVILLANSVHPDGAAGADAAAREGGDHRRRGARHRPQRLDAHRSGCAGGAEVPAAPGEACRPHHQPNRRGPPGPPQCRPDARGGRSSGCTVLARARARGQGRPPRPSRHYRRRLRHQSLQPVRQDVAANA